MAYQNAAWLEARVAAESGVDAALGDLLRNETGTPTQSWNGWWQKQSDGKIVRVPPGLLKKLLRGSTSSIAKLTKKLGLAPEPSAESGEPIFLDNVKVSTSKSLPTQMDVRLWALKPADPALKAWVRIRSMATCALPRTAVRAPLGLDARLRRFSLKSVRERLREDDAGQAQTIPLPNVSRTVEVLAEPIMPFELAIWADGPITLPSVGKWVSDSYDSRDSAKSGPGGIYPGRGTPTCLAHGHIASNRARPVDEPYGPLIDLRGSPVRGTIATNGGDDPDTPEHENVAGGQALVSGQVSDAFHREMPMITRPVDRTPVYPPLPGVPFTPGTEDAPAVYLVQDTLGAFSVSPAQGSAMGAIIILADRDLRITDGPVVIPPNVAAEIYVRGSILIDSQMVNFGPQSSNRSAQLLIFGEGKPEGPLAAPRTLEVRGPARVCAAFYGPRYEANIDGRTDWCGSIAGHSFIGSAGDGGVHYDEALRAVGPPVSFRILRYIEDVRQ